MCMERLFCQFVVFPHFLNCLLFLIYIFSFDLFFFACLAVFTQVGPSVLKIFRDDFSREWYHLCPRYLGVMFYPSGTICAQNVRFYIEATIIVHGEIMLPVCCFPPFSQLFAFAYIYFYLTCSFLLACRFSPKWDHLCPRYLGVIFHPSGSI